jgi:hypothetical protein
MLVALSETIKVMGEIDIVLSWQTLLR